MKSYSVKFNGNDLANVDGVYIHYYEATNLPDRDIKINKLARRSLSIITSSEYTQKQITVNAIICSGQRHDTEQTITFVKGLLQAQNGELIVEQGDGLYEYTATMNEFNIEWVAGKAYCTIVFLSSTPIAQASESETLISFNNTLQSATASFTVGGSYLAEPIINITVNSISGSGSMSIFNSSTNQGITFTEPLANGDIIEIDCTNYTITVNGSNKDFEGIFPTFPPGSQRIGYTDTFSSRNVDITVTYNARVV